MLFLNKWWLLTGFSFVVYPFVCRNKDRHPFRIEHELCLVLKHVVAIATARRTVNVKCIVSGHGGLWHLH